MDRHTAISEAKRQAREAGEGFSAWAILCADGAYIVAMRKPSIRPVKSDVIRCDWDGMTYPD